MNAIKHITAAIVLITYPVYATNAVVPTDGASEAIFKKFGKSPEEIVYQYAKKAPQNSDDYLTDALAYFAQHDVKNALDLANSGVALCKNHQSKIPFYILIAECHGALGDYTYAADAALKGLRENPQSVELAALRYAYARKSGDELEAAAAEDHLKQIDSTFKNNPKISIGTVIVIVDIALHSMVALLKVEDASPKAIEVTQDFAQVVDTVLLSVISK